MAANAAAVYEEHEAEIIAFPTMGRHYPKNVRVDNLAKRALKRTDDEVIHAVLTNFTVKMNAALIANDLDPIDTHDEIERSVEVALMVQRYRNSGGDLDVAMGIFPNQIEIIAKVMAALLNGERDIALLAETQFGKTGILCTVILLFNLYQHKRGSKVFIRMINPNLLGVEKQTTGDLERFSALLSSITLDGVTVREANAVYFNQRARISRKANTKVNNASEKELLALLSQGYDATLNQFGYTEQLAVVDEADEALGNKSYMDKMMGAAKSIGVKTRFLFCSATAWEYKCLSSFQVIEAPVTQDYAGFVRGTRIPVISFGTMARLVGRHAEGLENFSITRDFKKLEIVTALIDRIAAGVPINTPTVVSDYFPHSPRKDQWVERAVTAGEIGFNGLRWNGGNGMLVRYGKNGDQLEHLIKRRSRSMAQKGITMMAYQGSGKGTEITVYAPGHPEADCDFVTYTIPASECVTVEDLLAAARKLFEDHSLDHGFVNFQFVIGVVGLARRAMRFPKECSFFLDMSEAPTTMTALEQGTLGRATGWGKITDRIMPIVCMSGKVTAVVQKVRTLFDIYGKKIPVIRPSMHAMKTYREPTFRVAVTLSLDPKGPMWDRYSPTLKQSLRRIEAVILSQTAFEKSKSAKSKFLSPVKKYWTKAGNTVCKEGEVAKGWTHEGEGFVRETLKYIDETGKEKTKDWTFFDIFGLLGEDGISEIEDIFTEDFGGNIPENKVTLLRPGQVRSDGRHYAVSSNQSVHVAYRSAEADEALGEGKFGAMGQREGRDPTIKNNGWAANVIDPSVIMTPKDGGRLVKLGLILLNDALNSRGVDLETIDQTYCKKNTAPGKHMTNEVEKDLIAELSKVKDVVED